MPQKGRGPEAAREAVRQAAREAVRQAAGGGCQSGWGGGYCRLQTPLRLALGVRETVAGHGLGAVEGGRVPPPLPMHPPRESSSGALLKRALHPPPLGSRGTRGGGGEWYFKRNNTR